MLWWRKPNLRCPTAPHGSRESPESYHHSGEANAWAYAIPRTRDRTDHNNDRDEHLGNMRPSMEIRQSFGFQSVCRWGGNCSKIYSRQEPVQREWTRRRACPPSQNGRDSRAVVSHHAKFEANGE